MVVDARSTAQPMVNHWQAVRQSRCRYWRAALRVGQQGGTLRRCGSLM